MMLSSLFVNSQLFRVDASLMEANLRILFLTATFPPRGGSSVQRAAKFTKYASRLGHELFVITTAYSGNLKDESLLSDLSDSLKVFRISPDPESYGKFTRKIFRFFYPDAYLYWGLKTIIKARSIIINNKVNVIFVSFGSPSALFAGILISRLYSLPIVLDIRDLWTITPMKNARNRPGTIIGRLDKFLEKLSWTHISQFIVVSEGYQQILTNIYGIEKKRVNVIYNGYDPEDFPTTEQLLSNYNLDYTQRAPTIRFAGFITEPRGLHALFLAIQEINESREKNNCIRFEVIGNNSKKRIQDIIGVNSLPSWFIVNGYKNHNDAVKFMSEANILALFQPSAQGMITGKFFEYAAAGPPILHLDNGTEELRNLIANYQLGISVNQNNSTEIQVAINALLNYKKQTNPPPLEFRRDYQARQFLEVIRSAMDSYQNT